MTKMKFYTATRPSSAVPVHQALLELDLPFELEALNLEAEENRRPEFLAINPAGLVPALVIDGAPMFEGPAILAQLGDRFGVERRLWPALGTPEHLKALSWVSWTYATLQPPVRLVLVASSAMTPEAMHHRPIAEMGQAMFVQRLGALEAQLEGRDYILGGGYTLVDLCVASTLKWGLGMGARFDGLPRVEAWLSRCTDRPSFRASWS